jgi:hypothetical protein
MDPAASVAVDNVTASALVVALINWAKIKFPMLVANGARLSRWASVVGAAIAAVGVNMVWQHGANPGEWQITVTGLTLAGVLTAGWAWVKHFAMQEIIYQGTKKNGAAPVPAGFGAASVKGVAPSQQTPQNNLTPPAK